jgi:hypothetical protein
MSSPTTNAPLRYTPAVESIPPDEAATTAEIVATMRKIAETTHASVHAGPQLRSVHAKSHGLINATLTIPKNLPESLAQGLFATPGAYACIIRLSTTPGDVLEDSISTPRGLALKILNVTGARLDESERSTSQDVLMVNAPAFAAKDPKAFLATLSRLEPFTDNSVHLKKLTSAIARGAEAIVELTGKKSGTLTGLGGEQEHNILGETFYTQTAFLHGPYIAKYALVPTSSSLTDLTRKPLMNNGEPNMIRNAVVDFFLQSTATWDFRVQLCTGLASMPVEDASIIWSEIESPYQTIATLTAAAQDPWTIEKIRAFDQSLSFSPWNGLAAHRPLGAINRARRPAYPMSAALRAASPDPITS